MVVNTPKIYKRYPVNIVDKGRFNSQKRGVDVTALYSSTADGIAPAEETTVSVKETLNQLLLDLKINGIIPAVGNTYAGTVESVTNEIPIEGASVHVQEFVHNVAGKDYFQTIGKTTTDASGEFLVEGLHPGYPYVFLIFADGYEDYSTREEYGVPWLYADDGATVTITHTLTPEY